MFFSIGASYIFIQIFLFWYISFGQIYIYPASYIEEKPKHLVKKSLTFSLNSEVCSPFKILFLCFSAGMAQYP